MRTIPGAEVDAWLRAGGMVVAASDRAARAVRAAYHRARREEGLSAWAAPEVLEWQAFVRREWDRRTSDGRLILNGKQEQSLWVRIIAESGQTDGWLEGPRRRLADLATEAQELLCAYAPDLLRARSRREWQQDAGAFSEWLTAFDDACGRDGLLSAARVAVEILPLLEEDRAGRAPLVLAGFDRLLPVQQRLFDAWGDCSLWSPRSQNQGPFRAGSGASSVAAGAAEYEVRSYVAANEQLELAACARWCRQRLEADAQARLLVVSADANQRRGEIERMFLKEVGTGPRRLFEFSLGVPLGQMGIARAALLLLRWLDGAIEEQELDWLCASGFAAAGLEESAALEAYMRALRRRNLERTRWTLDAFLGQSVPFAAPTVAWERRMRAAQQGLRKALSRALSPPEWAGLAAQLLETVGWPGSRGTTSVEFQAASRWQQALDQCASLGFDGRRVEWTEFVAELERTLDEMLFAEESQDARIVVVGPAESAGLIADGIWFLGADENTWPAAGSTHPLIPIEAQRAAGMPHATPQRDWELAESITLRLLASAPEVCFSHARLKEDVETRPSRLVVQGAGAPQEMPPELAPDAAPEPVAVPFEDTATIELTGARMRKGPAQLSLFDTGREPPAQVYPVAGGSGVLTSQSQCAFKAFATARLGAEGWEAATAGLTARQRGQLLHAVLHSVWSEKGIRSWNQLQNLGADLRAFVEGHVRQVLKEQLPAGAREQMPARYLELEEQRLTSLVTDWLEFERKRVEFEVATTEVKSTAVIAGLTLNLRLDRVDRLNDGSLLVIDYKSGNVTPRSWDLPRPDDVQLPLYAGFAVPQDQKLGGLVFAKVRAGEMCIAGKVADAPETLNHDLKANNNLVKDALTLTEVSEWKRAIEQLARDYIAGRADVDPRDAPETCERCGLYTLCRVRERDDLQEEEEIAPEAGDE